MKRTVSGILLALLLVGIITSAVNIQPAKTEPTTIVVPDNYPTIQEAINIAEVGNVVYVKSGVYYERIFINKSITILGENKFDTILDGKTDHWPVAIYETNYVTFSGFTVANSTGIYGYGGGGIYLMNSNSCIIKDSILLSNQYGIGLYGSSDNIIFNNFLAENGANILVTSLDLGDGESLGSYNNTFLNNILRNSPYGPAFDLDDGTQTKIIGNTIANNKWGINIHPHYCNHIIYHNNFINNTCQVQIHNFIVPTPSIIVWNNDYPSGGNYWSDYNGTDTHSGPYQNETGSDEIGDTSYSINENNTDHYPLMEPYQLMKPYGLWVLGDVDSNGKVEIKDIFFLAKAYGSYLGQLNYNSYLDINFDNKIDIKEVFIAAKNYGQTDP